MKRLLLLTAFTLLVNPSMARGVSGLSSEITTSTVFIVNYSKDNALLGWGSGFFVDEGIVVTNRHVIEAGDWFRVYATGSDEKVDFQCFKKIIKSDVRINLDDDVAYMRVFLPCEHGVMDFVADPLKGDPVSVLGYPYKGSGSVSTELTVTTGDVLGRSKDGWHLTSAHMDLGSSGGPVVNEAGVLGVAVAKSVDAQGRYVAGYFIPSSVILGGLLYANDSRFGYIPRGTLPRLSSASSVSSSLPRSSQQSTSSASSRMRSSSSRRSSLRPSATATFPDVIRTREGYAAIHLLQRRGVISGYADGTFRPDEGINRAEFIKLLVSGFRPGALRDEGTCFKDVSAEWFAPYVCAAKRLGWVEGYQDGTFKPAQLISRAEAMKILVQAFNGNRASDVSMPSDVRTGMWFYPYVAKGVEAGMIDPRYFFHPGQNLTREDGAIWIYKADQ